MKTENVGQYEEGRDTMDWDALAMLRIRRVSPERRSGTSNTPSSNAFERFERRAFKCVQIAPATGVIFRGFETKSPFSPLGGTPQAEPSKIAMPIPGDLRGVQGGDDFGRPDAAPTPRHEFLKGALKGFRRSGSGRRPGGWRK